MTESAALGTRWHHNGGPSLTSCPVSRGLKELVTREDSKFLKNRPPGTSKRRYHERVNSELGLPGGGGGGGGLPSGQEWVKRRADRLGGGTHAGLTAREWHLYAPQGPESPLPQPSVNYPLGPPRRPGVVAEGATRPGAAARGLAPWKALWAGLWSGAGPGGGAGGGSGRGLPPARR